MSLSSSFRKPFLIAAIAFFAGAAAFAQQNVPSAPSPAPSAPATLTFTTPDPKNFSADKPTPDDVNAFLKATWGYDPNLAWQTMAIAKTPVAGVSKVTVAIGQKNNP